MLLLPRSHANKPANDTVSNFTCFLILVSLCSYREQILSFQKTSARRVFCWLMTAATPRRLPPNAQYRISNKMKTYQRSQVLLRICGSWEWSQVRTEEAFRWTKNPKSSTGISLTIVVCDGSTAPSAACLIRFHQLTRRIGIVISHAVFEGREKEINKNLSRIAVLFRLLSNLQMCD